MTTTRKPAKPAPTPELRRKLRVLGQQLDPLGVPGTYSEGVLRPKRQNVVLPFPWIHSCLWLHPDGRVLNYGFGGTTQ